MAWIFPRCEYHRDGNGSYYEQTVRWPIFDYNTTSLTCSPALGEITRGCGGVLLLGGGGVGGCWGVLGGVGGGGVQYHIRPRRGKNALNVGRRPATVLSRCLSNFKLFGKHLPPIWHLWEFARSYDKTSYAILNRPPEYLQRLYSHLPRQVASFRPTLTHLTKFWWNMYLYLSHLAAQHSMVYDSLFNTSQTSPATRLKFAERSFKLKDISTKH